ncbi:MAG: hypothetical protein LBQ63_05120 [Deltaproteobacteria bacterium]|nr:hypothetical protein [Deltaproteobacteria bacterium]
MPEFVPPHPRALIRHAVVRTLKEHPAVAALLGERVYPNREEHWLQDELPAAGVYTLSEQALDSDVSPDPRERRIDLAVEILAGMSEAVDDTLDRLCLAVERALCLDAIGEAMGAIINEMRAAAGLPPMEKIRRDGRLLWPVDTLLTLKLTGTDIGIAVEGDRQIGVAVLSYDLEYDALAGAGPLPDFLLAMAGWDVEPHDGKIDMESRMEFEPPENE